MTEDPPASGTIVAPRRVPTVGWIALTVGLVALLVVVLAVTRCAPEATPNPSATATANAPTTESAEPTEEPTEEPGAWPTAEATAAPAAPAPILLSATAIGDIPIGTADPVPALLGLLGPDGAMVGSPGEPSLCGGPEALTAYRWSDLIVRIADGALWGWTLLGLDLPADVTTESGVMPGAPLSDATALPGAAAPSYRESMDSVLVEADDVWYWADGSDPATGVISTVQVNAVTCD